MKNSAIVTANSSRVIGVLNGWDRLVFRGCIPLLSYLDAMLLFLRHMGILLKDYSEWALHLSDELKGACLAEATRLGRPVRYLRSSKVRKDELARQILRESPVSEGLVCVLTCLEPCRTFRLRGNRQTKQLELRAEQTKCLHVYKYWIDSQFGFMGARLQTWLPCEVQVWINGREWLARKMDRRGIDYQRRDNCFPWIENFPAAQRLFHQMQGIRWIGSLDRVLRRLCPAYASRLDRQECYWTALQTEWATDICFDEPDTLRRREEGIRVKHYAGGNSVKAYDKAESVLRIESTISQPGQFRVYRSKQGEEAGPKAWRLLRRHGVIRKVKNQRRYHVTTQGRQMLAAILTAQHATVQQLNALAA